MSTDRFEKHVEMVQRGLRASASTNQMLPLFKVIDDGDTDFYINLVRDSKFSNKYLIDIEDGSGCRYWAPDLREALRDAFLNHVTEDMLVMPLYVTQACYKR